MSIFCCTSKKTKEQTTKKNLNHKQAATFPPPGIIHQSKVSLSRGTTEETELHYLVWHLQRQQLLLHLSEPVVVCMVRGWAFIKLLQHLSTLCELMCFWKCIPCRWWKLFLWRDESTAEQVANADVSVCQCAAGAHLHTHAASVWSSQDSHGIRIGPRAFRYRFSEREKKKKIPIGSEPIKKQMAWENVIPKENRTCSLGWFHSSRTPDEKRKHIVTRWNKQDFRVNRVEARAKISLLPLWVKLYLLPWCQIKLKQRKIDIFTWSHWTIEG